MQALSRTIAKAPLRPLAARTLAVRTLSTSPRTFSEAAPSLFGEGSKAGHVPTDIEQATGLERLQLIGQLHGVDVFKHWSSSHHQTRTLAVWSLLTCVVASMKGIRPY